MVVTHKVTMHSFYHITGHECRTHRDVTGDECRTRRDEKSSESVVQVNTWLANSKVEAGEISHRLAKLFPLSTIRIVELSEKGMPVV